jgi:hypothetical protein
METPNGWVGSWDKAALDQFVEPADEAVLYQHKTPLLTGSGEVLVYSEWKNGMAGLPDWPERSLYTRPQPVKWQEIECPCCGELARAFPPAPEPELLKALKALVSSAERVSVGEYDEETLDINLSQARAAIKKFTGENT